MVLGHINVKRIVHRISEELDATSRIAKVTSWRDAMETFRAKIDIQIMNRNGYKETEKIRTHLLKKHDVMMNYFERMFDEYLWSYDFEKTEVKKSSEHLGCVWVCWWQGEKEAPAIVKRCIDSIRRNARGHSIIVITEQNYKNFVSFPEWIEEKKRKGIISRTHYSDLLRLELLSKYGGIWLDATFFCTGNEIDQYFSWSLWSIKRPDYFHASVASGYFANYSLGCDASHRRIFAAIRDFAIQYWKMNDIMIDYLFLDYLIVLAQRNIEEVGQAFGQIQPNNPMCDELFKVLGQPFDKDLWNKLKAETSLFKLTWKQTFPLEKNGRPTFYKMLLDDML